MKGLGCKDFQGKDVSKWAEVGKEKERGLKSGKKKLLLMMRRVPRG